jgi:small GTP-binding protein
MPLRTGELERAAAYARALDEDHPGALVVRARLALRAGERDQARTLISSALDRRDSVDARLAASMLSSIEGDIDTAAAHLRRAIQLDSDDARPREALRALFDAELSTAAHEDLGALLATAHRLLTRSPELGRFAIEVSRLLELLDQPLLITVMGEFNAGKSTFVNALLGEKVAPMGITPTTATINVLKYGAERAGRVRYLDEHTRDVAWADVPGLLRGLDAAEATRIAMVEVLYPLEVLQRVNIVDTPGLNSILPEHEATARRFIGEADAVVWLFSVDQAAKATESGALDAIRAAGRKVLGVLNKIDRCSPEDLKRIEAHIMEVVGTRLEGLVPFGAKDALTAIGDGDQARLAASNLAGLQRTLEEQFFSRARELKRSAVRLRLIDLLTRTGAELMNRAQALATNPIDQAMTNLRAERELIARTFFVDERKRLDRAAAEVFDACAKEVLDFARPRSWVFGSNEASPADRDFLLDLIDGRVAALLDGSRARLDAELERCRKLAREVGLEFAGEALPLDEAIYQRYRSFVRGFLRGGKVDDFFTRTLPKLELAETSIRRALERTELWSDEVVTAELMRPLEAWTIRYLDDLLGRVERLRRALEVQRFELDARIAGPIERLLERSRGAA